MNVVELFSGSGTFTDIFKSAGHNTFSIDLRKRKGVCEPDLRKDIMQLTSQDIPFNKCHVLWASPPCDVWSYASNDFHWDEFGYPKTIKCLKHIQLLNKCLELIEQISPEYYFIENPRGRMRKSPMIKQFLSRTSGSIKSCTLSSYGFPTTKPTNIFTNAIGWIPRKMHAFGRGAKVRYRFDNITKCSRQKTPRPLAEDILAFCEGRKYQVLLQ